MGKPLLCPAGEINRAARHYAPARTAGHLRSPGAPAPCPGEGIVVTAEPMAGRAAMSLDYAGRLRTRAG